MINIQKLKLAIRQKLLNWRLPLIINRAGAEKTPRKRKEKCCKFSLLLTYGWKLTCDD